MQFRNVKVGERYKCWRDSDPCQAIEKLPRSQTQNYPEVILCHADGNVFRAPAGYLEPWDEFLDGEHQEALSLNRALDAVEQMNKLVGGGIVCEIRAWGTSYYLRFSEAAAEAVLQLSGAKPLPEERRPSQLPEGRERSRLQALLGTRLVRALGCGRGGEWLTSELRGQNQQMARVEFQELDLDRALERLRGGNDAAASPLASLLN